MAEAQVKLGYILDPLFQVENTNGKPVVGGHIEVYEAGTNVKYITYQNFDFTQNPFKIPLGSDGRAVVLGDCDLSYDVYIYDSFNNLIVSRLNVAAGDAGGVAGGGLREVIHDETMTGKGTQLSPLGVSPLTNLAVDETMTAYEATVEGKDSLVLGVNGDWFYNQFGSAFSGKVDWSAFNSAYYGLKGDISSKADWSALNNYYTKNETYNNFLPRSAIDLNNYYTKNEVYNKNEVDNLLTFKENRLDFGYNDSSAISSINGSALAGQGGDGNCPWISGTKVIADTQTLTSNMIVQILSSFDLSGYKNHNIGLKGGTYRFPNEYEIGSALLHTNYFMHLSGMSAYLSQSAFSSYTTYAEGRMDSIFQLANSAYTTAVNNFYNKLDASAFSSYSAGQDTIINNITEQITNISNASGDWNDISAYQQNSANYLTGVDLSNYYQKNETSSKQEISAAIAAIPQGDPDVNNVVQTNSGIWNNKLDSSSYHELTAGTNIDIQNYVISSKDWTNEIREASANAFNEATAANPTSSTQWNSCYETVNTNSGDWNKVSAKLDISSFEAYTATDETYLLKGGFNIGISSDDVNKETTIYYTGTNGDEQVNNVVRQYSANGTWLTAHQDISNLMPKSYSSNFYPMTGNPSGFLTGVDISNYYQKNETSSKGEIENALTSKLDTTAFTAWSSTFITDDYELSAGSGIALVDDAQNKITRIDFTGTSGPDLSAGEGIAISTNGGKTIIRNNISAGSNISLVYDQETNKIRIDGEGREYTGVAPIQVNNSTNEISITGESLSAGPGIDLFESGGYVVISAAGGGGGGGSYNGISPIVVNNNTNQISAKGVSFGVQSPLFFVQDDNEAVIIGCSAGGGVTGEFVPLSSFNELKQSYDALSSLFATYSGQWLLPNEGV